MPCEFRRALEVRRVGLSSTRSCFGSCGESDMTFGTCQHVSSQVQCGPMDRGSQ